MPAPSPALSATTFRHAVRVYWEDTDAGGIVFYANYLKFFERARTEWLRELGFGQQQLREREGGMFVVSETQLRYLHPAKLDDVLLVTAKPHHIGRAAVEISQQAFLQSAVGPDGPPSGTTPTLACEGSIRLSWVSAARLRPARMPATLLQALSTLQTP